MKKKKQIKKYLFDIKVAIESVEDYVSNVEDLKSYRIKNSSAGLLKGRLRSLEKL